MITLGPWNNDENIIHFGGCAFDSETQTFQTATDFVRLRSKLWQVLIELIKTPNKLVSRDMLIDDIWKGNRYTGEQGITHSICHLRRILKKHNIPATIITLPKKGYILRVKQERLAEAHIGQPVQFKVDNQESNDVSDLLYYSN